MRYSLLHGVAADKRVSEPVIAREIFDRLRQATANDPEVLTELCRDYIAEARVTMLQLQEALAHGDAAQFRERAHYLKGSSMMIGARNLSQSCATLELMGRDANLAAAGTELDNAGAALKEVETTLSLELGPTVLPGEGSAA